MDIMKRPVMPCGVVWGSRILNIGDGMMYMAGK
jgi:hypothetical protein